MATIDNRDAAMAAKQLYENYQAHMQSDWGEKLRSKLAAIKDGAVSKSMEGKAPERDSEFYESRGAVSAVNQVRGLFAEVEKDYDTAVKWLQANPPQEGAASEKA